MTFSDKQYPATEYMTKTHHRRGLLRYLAVGAAILMILPAAFADPAKTEPRALSFYNLHTEEKLNTIYWQDGHYQQDALAAINQVLRDHRSGEYIAMDPQLLDLLF